MSININDAFLKDLENFSDEDDIFTSKNRDSEGGTKEIENKSTLIINLNDTADKLLNSTRLRNSKRFQEFLKEIEFDTQKSNSNPSFYKNQNFKSSNAFKLINESHQFIQDINHDISLISKYIKEIYSKRFPELESQVLTPYEYALTVKSLGNDLDVMKKDLSFLPNHNIMAINIISSTTSGKPLNINDLTKLNLACDQIIKLNKDKILILDYISTRMTLIAPNVCALAGSNVAAKIITAAGGIIELSKMPASNILVLGAKKQNLAGFSTAGKLHLGYLAEIEEVKKTPEDFKRQAMRRFSNKIALAARIDAFRRPSDIKANNEGNVSGEIKKEDVQFVRTQTNNQDINHNDLKKEDNKTDKFSNYFEETIETDNNKMDIDNSGEDNENNIEAPEKNSIVIDGAKLREEISKKMIKIQEPQQAKIIKPLPKPDDKPRRKRGGKRMRNKNQRYAYTELRLMKNRMKFGEEAEIEYRDTGKGFGMIGVGGAGSKLKVNVKKQNINTKRQKLAKLETQKEIQKSGLVSNVSFTPFEGMELINPNLSGRTSTIGQSNKYFEPTSGFATVMNSKTSNSSIINLNKN